MSLLFFHNQWSFAPQNEALHFAIWPAVLHATTYYCSCQVLPHFYKPDLPSSIFQEVSSDPLLVSSRHLAAVCALLIPQGFTVNGKYGDKDVYDSYLNKCVWVKGQGTSTNSALKGFVMNEMKVHNCG